jgi:hypothetical protein
MTSEYRGPGSAYQQREYIPHAHPACLAGCQFAKASDVAALAAQITDQLGVKSMSQALWCDATEHAFSERDPGRQRISVAEFDEDGNQTLVSKDFCGECAAALGLTKPKRKGKYDPVKTRVLESQAGLGDDSGS